jgi:hypothetical protein
MPLCGDGTMTHQGVAAGWISAAKRRVKHRAFAGYARKSALSGLARPYSTVTDLARLRGWSTSVPIITAVW